jgi:hypothetical protein
MIYTNPFLYKEMILRLYHRRLTFIPYIYVKCGKKLLVLKFNTMNSNDNVTHSKDVLYLRCHLFIGFFS